MAQEPEPAAEPRGWLTTAIASLGVLSVGALAVGALALIAATGLLLAILTLMCLGFASIAGG